MRCSSKQIHKQTPRQQQLCMDIISWSSTAEERLLWITSSHPARMRSPIPAMAAEDRAEDQAEDRAAAEQPTTPQRPTMNLPRVLLPKPSGRSPSVQSRCNTKIR